MTNGDVALWLLLLLGLIAQLALLSIGDGLEAKWILVCLGVGAGLRLAYQTVVARLPRRPVRKPSSPILIVLDGGRDGRDGRDGHDDEEKHA